MPHSYSRSMRATLFTGSNRERMALPIQARHSVTARERCTKRQRHIAVSLSAQALLVSYSLDFLKIRIRLCR